MFNKTNEESLQSKLLYYSFKIQKICGLFPYQKKHYMLPGLLNLLTHSISIGLVVCLMYYNLNDVETLMSGFEAFIANIQCFLKCLPILLHKQQMKILIEELSNFERTKNEEEYKFWIRLSKLYIILVLFTIIALVVYPGYLFKYYVPNFPYSYAIILIIDKIQFAYSGLYLLAIDLFYLACFVIIKVQLQTLKADLELLEASENKYESLKLWINQHIFLTRYTKRFASTFSEALLLEYVVATINLCTNLYFFGSRDDGLFMSILYIATLLVQVCLICLTADEITNKALDLADALYSMEWYNFPHREMKMLPLLIQQTQAPVRFVAGGLVNLDKRAMATMLKNSYTFFALARQMNQN